MLRILMVYNSWDVSEAGGVVSMLKDLMGGLDAKYEIHLLVESWEARLCRDSVDRERRCYYRLRFPVPPNSLLSLKEWLSWLTGLPICLQQVTKLCRSKSIDLIHIHYPSPAHLPFLVAKRMGGPPFIFTCHGGDIAAYPRMNTLQRAVMRATVRGADAVTAVSRWLTNRAASTLSLSTKPVTIHNGYRLPELNKPYMLRGTTDSTNAVNLPGKYAVIIGNSRHYKGHDIAIKAWAKVIQKYPEFTLLIVGGGPLMEEMKKLALDLGVAGAVRFTGHVPREVVLGILEKATVLVAPSRNEGQGLMILEAGALGVPVICSDIPPFLEMVRPGETAFVFPSEDPTELATLVCKVVEGLEEAEVIGRRLRQVVQEHFSIQRMVSAYEGVYLRCLDPTFIPGSVTSLC